MHARLTQIALVVLAASSCASNTDTGSNLDASITDAASSDAADTANAPPCWTTAAPPDASPAEQLGVVGECCTTSDTCKSNSICVGGRCCIHLRDSGRRCAEDSDCCSGQCPTQNDDDAGRIAGQCVAYTP